MDNTTQDPNHAADCLILGAGAAGLMCGLTAGQRGRRVVILDHATTPGEKVRIAGGGRCNFSNRQMGPEHYRTSHHPDFCLSALRSFTPADFIALLDRHRIGWHEEEHGQLFCDDSGRRIVTMLLEENRQAGVTLRMRTRIQEVTPTETGFTVTTDQGDYHAQSLVIATGGLSIPKLGASDLGWRLAKGFGVPVIPPRPGLVPLILSPAELAPELAGISCPATVKTGQKTFHGPLLFTHNGLSGPAILQISSYWQPGEPLTIDLTPGLDLLSWLKENRKKNPKQGLLAALSCHLPKRLAHHLLAQTDPKMADLSDAQLKALATQVQRWEKIPQGWAGYRTAEVTVGGVDTRALSSKTMACRTIPGLYFIGEVVDITGHLGGYNLQWAWSSGVAAGRAV